ncbi:MAG TPA: SEC-C metal-binding domain-containing protein, partial [Bacillales bacterium]|nr:SEC-C metal-binding domain-containing protein [Bacillales bacterium]
SKMVSRSVESAQKRVEGNNFDARKQVLQYDDVMRQQREIIYKQRAEVIESENLRSIVEDMIHSTIERIVKAHTPDEQVPEEWDLKAIIDYANATFLYEGEVTEKDIKGKDPEEIIELMFEVVKKNYDRKEAEMTPEQMREFEKVIVLHAVDSRWMDHIDAMDQLRQGIHLRAYGQNDPLREYQFEGFQMFEEMVTSIEEEVSTYVMKAQVEENMERQKVAEDESAYHGEEDDGSSRNKPVVKGEKVGRNDPCPCGSGKKYKHCHGR